VRHAEAESDHPLGDWARGLTPAGRASFRRSAREIASLVKLRGIATSPYVRAVQTAELLAEACSLSEVRVRAELIPQKKAAAQIERLAEELVTGWALVGHNPSLAEAAARLLGLPVLPLNLKKGSALALRRRGTGFGFQWLASPGAKLLTRLPR
jgi:phosphohistidine phosphatase